ncbi:MAG: hypothetical protein KKD07_08015 [Candidatus Omnitrophica bacterium]|nr:hypothetical protein [Candidatus Omnitrophota bacterium]MBU1996019.1 hypothetical protein [Candidatus Omnitrophota bacterium]MBU4334368.1 hypothetical protein [Candidatus Omnitrophota bacterium]
MKQFNRDTHKKLGELLIERGVINHAQIEEALEYREKNGGLIGEVLVELNFATEKDIAQAITCQYGFPYLPLLNYEIDDEVINAIPENVCRQFCLIPIDKIGKSLTIAMSDPLNVKSVEDIELITGCIVQFFVSTSSDIKQSIDKYYKQK